jgi:hypothetical protein
VNVLVAQQGPGGLSTSAHVLIAIGTVLTVAFILVMLRRNEVRSKYALLWTVVGLFLGVLAAFPGLLDWLSERVGIDYPPALFLLLATGFLFLVVIEFSRELTRLDARTRTLAEEVAFLRRELNEPEDGRREPPGRPDDREVRRYDRRSDSAPEKATD